jgi:hypothetical protein
MKKGIALITVIWILAILITLIGILVFLTSTDISYTFIFNKKRLALGAAEYGKNEVISKIPQQDLLQAMIANDALFYGDSLHAAFLDTIGPNRYYLVSPIPFPVGIMKWGTGGRWLKLFDFTVGGRCVTAKGDIERTVNVGAAYVHPYTDAASAGHTMY